MFPRLNVVSWPSVCSSPVTLPFWPCSLDPDMGAKVLESSLLFRHFSELVRRFLICLYILGLFNFDYFILTLFMYLPLLYVSWRLLLCPRILPGFGICYSYYLPFVFVFCRLLLLPLPARELSELGICYSYYLSFVFVFCRLLLMFPWKVPGLDAIVILVVHRHVICTVILQFALRMYCLLVPRDLLLLCLFFSSFYLLPLLFPFLLFCFCAFLDIFFYFLLLLRRLRSQHVADLLLSGTISSAAGTKSKPYQSS